MCVYVLNTHDGALTCAVGVGRGGVAPGGWGFVALLGTEVVHTRIPLTLAAPLYTHCTHTHTKSGL